MIILLTTNMWLAMKRRILFGTYGSLLMDIYYYSGVCLYGFILRMLSQSSKKGLKKENCVPVSGYCYKGCNPY